MIDQTPAQRTEAQDENLAEDLIDSLIRDGMVCVHQCGSELSVVRKSDMIGFAPEANPVKYHIPIEFINCYWESGEPVQPVCVTGFIRDIFND